MARPSRKDIAVALIGTCTAMLLLSAATALAQSAGAPTDLLRGTSPTPEQSAQPEPTFSQPLNLEQERETLNTPASTSPLNTATPPPAPPALPLSTRDPRNARVLPASPVGELRSDGTITPLANTRVVPLQGTATGREEDPFAALGIRTGSFLLFPVLTQTFGTTDNADGTSAGNADSFSTTDLRATLISNWSVHQLRAEIGGSYQTFFNGTIDDLPRFDANFELRYDAARDLTVRVGGNAVVEQQTSGTSFINSQTASEVTQDTQETTIGGFVEVEKQTGRLLLRLRGSLTNRQSTANGSGTDSADTLAEARLRVAYDTSAIATPFLEAGLGVRFLDGAGAGVDESTLYSLRGGFQFDRGDKLNGEIGLGYATETFSSSAQGDLQAFTLDGTINWSPIRLTTITATAQTGFDIANTSGDLNSTVHVAGLSITRDVRPNLSLNARVLASLRSFQGSNREDVTVQTEVGAEWRLSRSAAFFGTLGYESVESNEEGSSFDATTARIGLRWQR